MHALKLKVPRLAALLPFFLLAPAAHFALAQ